MEPPSIPQSPSVRQLARGRGTTVPANVTWHLKKWAGNLDQIFIQISARKSLNSDASPFTLYPLSQGHAWEGTTVGPVIPDIQAQRGGWVAASGQYHISYPMETERHPAPCCGQDWSHRLECSQHHQPLSISTVAEYLGDASRATEPNARTCGPGDFMEGHVNPKEPSATTPSTHLRGAQGLAPRRWEVLSDMNTLGRLSQ